MNQDFEHFDQKELRRMLLKKTVLLDWALIEREFACRYCKQHWRKLKRPVVLPPQLVEAQRRLYALKKKLNRARLRTSDIIYEMSAVELVLRNYAWYAIDPRTAAWMVEKSRAHVMPSEQTTLEDLMCPVEQLPPEGNVPEEIPVEAIDDPAPPTRRPHLRQRILENE
jgi:hypothetical protein